MKIEWVHCVALALVAVLSVVLLTACSSSQAPAEAAPSSSSRSVSVRVVPATSGSISLTKSYAAIVEARDLVNVGPVSSGRVEKLTVDIGSEVRKGEVVAELSHGTLDAQLQREQAALRDAQAKLAALQAAIETKENRAQAELEAARVKLDQLLHPPATKIQIASSEVRMAQSKLDSARTKLSQLLDPKEADLADARHEVAQAQSELFSAQEKVTEAITKYLKEGTLSGEASSVWGIVLTAQASLQASRARLFVQPALGWNLTPAEVEKHQRIVAANQEIISELLESGSLLPIPESIVTAVLVESEARSQVDSATAGLTELQSPSSTTIALAQHDIDVAQAELDAAQAELDVLKNPEPADLAVARAEVAEAEETLALSQMVYARYDIEAAQARVDEVQAQVNLVQQQLAELQVIAPFDAFVTRRWLAPGAMASPQSPVVTIASKDVVVSLRIEETGVASLQRGQGVTFTTPALPGQRLDLEVEQIAASGDERSHTFSVLMKPSETTPALKPGMSGQVSIVIEQDDVVLAPKESVLHQGGEPSVFVIREGLAHSQKVEVGLVDDKNVVLRNGVQPGDQIVVSGQGLLIEGDSVTIEQPSKRSGP